MRILMLTAHLPYPPNTGGAIRTYSLLRGLAQRHEMHLLTSAQDAVPTAFTDALRRHCQSITILPRADFNRAAPRAVSERVEAAAIDLVFCSYLDTAVHCAHLQHVPVVVDLYDIVSRLVLVNRHGPDRPWSAPRRLVRFLKVRRRERAVARHATMLMVTSENDLRLAQSFAGDCQLAIVPNGVDLASYTTMPLAAGDANELLFVGGFHWQPNVEAVHYFCRDILPRIAARNPATRLTIVGDSPPASILTLASEHVSIMGYVEDVRRCYERAGVVVVPLLGGSGTRLKVLEAMAAGRPVVATTIGAEGLQVRDGGDLLIADDPGSFADAVLRLQHNHEMAARMAAHGRQTIAAAGYDWQSIVERLDQLLERTVERFQSRRREVRSGTL